MLTNVTYFPEQGYWAKRDDLACWTGPDLPSGSKVRQYTAMAQAQPGLPMLVGCSAHSAMQIYVAAASRVAGVKGVVFTAKRKVRTDATLYAKRMGAKVVEIGPGGYLNVLQAKAREYGRRNKDFKAGYVHWQQANAVADAAAQVANVTPLVEANGNVKQIIIPVGSGLVAAGVLAGLATSLSDRRIPVLAVAVSPMATVDHIKETAIKHIVSTGNNNAKAAKKLLWPLRLVRAVQKYEDWVAEVLPDGTPLDPYYAAKAMPFVRKGDLLWLPGLRPMQAMPEKCQAIIRDKQKALQHFGPSGEFIF